MRVRGLLVCMLTLAASVVLVRVLAFSSEQTPASEMSLVYTAAAKYDAPAWTNAGERFPSDSLSHEVRQK